MSYLNEGEVAQSMKKQWVNISAFQIVGHNQRLAGQPLVQEGMVKIKTIAIYCSYTPKFS